jgi:hypothetical protein
MVADKLKALDRTLRDHQPALYDALKPGVEGRRIHSEALREWFAWKDGQGDGVAPFASPLFFGWHRFVPYDEGQSHLRSMRRAAWTNPIRAVFFLTLGRHLLRSWPLLVDASGVGYYFDSGSQTVVYRLEGEADASFESFERFVDYLIELSGISANQETFLNAEHRLLERYVYQANGSGQIDRDGK